MALRQHLFHQAREEKFLDWGLCSLESLPVNENFLQFIQRGYHGEMQWLETSAEVRSNPAGTIALHFPSALVLSYSYFHSQNIEAAQSTGISLYALGRDYHKVIEPRLKRIAKAAAASLPGLVTRYYTDTGPLSEKVLAQAAGLGWIGKNTNLISRRKGSWFFLSVLLINARLQADSPEDSHCGTCVRCLEHCPTNALIAPYQMDARLCLSYQTIEKRSGSDPLLMEGSQYLYGCDDCQTCCPYNRFTTNSDEQDFLAREDYSPIYFASLTENRFLQEFQGSPIRRIGYLAFMRNFILKARTTAAWPQQELLSILKNHSEPAIREMVTSLWTH
jgi:epoxyqueuosine reductase